MLVWGLHVAGMTKLCYLQLSEILFTSRPQLSEGQKQKCCYHNRIMTNDAKCTTEIVVNVHLALSFQLHRNPRLASYLMNVMLGLGTKLNLTCFLGLTRRLMSKLLAVYSPN